MSTSVSREVEEGFARLRKWRKTTGSPVFYKRIVIRIKKSDGKEKGLMGKMLISPPYLMLLDQCEDHSAQKGDAPSATTILPLGDIRCSEYQANN